MTASRIPASGWWIGLSLAFTLTAMPVLGDDDPRGWLDRMASALESMNYEGTLVQLNGGDVAVMRIVHRVEGGQRTERITAMDEVGREIIRQGDELTWILPDQNAVMVETRGTSGPGTSPLRRQFAGDLDVDDRYYRLTIASGGKLVGRDTRVIAVRPTDSYRYGYRLWLDKATAMPLKVQIVGDDDGVVEQLLFSDIRLPERIPASAVQPSVTIARFNVRQESAAPASLPGPPMPGQAAWRVERLPPGFVLLAVRASRSAEPDTALVDQLVYSDGVARVSVFIESQAAPAGQPEGPSRMGAANAYTTVAEGRMVTAMGEVPLRTVEAMAKSVRSVARPGR